MSKKMLASFGAAYGLFWLAVLVGWIANVVQIALRVNDPITGLFIFKCVGVVLFPVGSVLGWVGFF